MVVGLPEVAAGEVGECCFVECGCDEGDADWDAVRIVGARDCERAPVRLASPSIRILTSGARVASTAGILRHETSPQRSSTY